ncbi:hypothetical protein LOK74_04110 [Brevibacillus humidisoli]|nr:hypothetical protein [Brevibacillus humidisoli]UFJ41706.1 hypothetical protein LOK74_04110 [Brevibacillus humidisoli]
MKTAYMMTYSFLAILMLSFLVVAIILALRRVVSNEAYASPRGDENQPEE